MYGVIVRIMFNLRHSLDRAADMFYWPATDLVLWGLTSLYFSTLSADTRGASVPILAGVLLWTLVHRGQQEVSISVLEELWNRNLVNLFVTPLTMGELVLSYFLVGIVKGVISFGVAGLIAYGLYSFNVTFFGLHLVPFILLLLMCGWWMGLIIAAFIMRYGTRVQTLAWTLAWVFSPFSAIYFPVSVLPSWAQTVAHAVPSSYVFEAARTFIASGVIDYRPLGVSFILSCIYIFFALIFFQSSFRVVLDRGLVKLN